MNESTAIMRFLANQYPEQAGFAYPDDVMQRYHIDRWIDFYHDQFRPAFKGYSYGVVQGSRPLDHRDRLILDRCSEQQLKVLKIVQAKLAETKFIAGDTISIADYSLYCMMSTATILSHDLTIYPEIIKWQDECMAASKGINEIHQRGSGFTRYDVRGAKAMINFLESTTGGYIVKFVKYLKGQ